MSETRIIGADGDGGDDPSMFNSMRVARFVYRENICYAVQQGRGERDMDIRLTLTRTQAVELVSVLSNLLDGVRMENKA